MTLQASYQKLIANGSLQDDAAQRLVLIKLEKLADALQTEPSIFGWWLRRKTSTPRGLYIWGDVGRGKTMLMDLFFANLDIPKKLRIHFHAFMQQVHAKRADIKSDDVIADIADDIASRAKLLCLDEMQISDIADAMIIGRLFEALQHRGVCLVTTSNLPPDGLYREGLNRHLFLPFIAKLNADLDVVALSGGLDYRLGRITSRRTYISPLGLAADAEMAVLWQELTDGAEGVPQNLEFLGRKLHVPYVAHGCAWFSFTELCEAALAAPDYLAIVQNFRTVFVKNIPVIKANQRNEAKRFILMIDTFYDARTRLVISAAVPAEQLCSSGQHRA